MEDVWSKILGAIAQAGREVIEKVLWLVFAWQRPDTPPWAKGVIAGALAYFVSPLDAIPDVTPIVGYSDDLLVLTAAIAQVALYVDEDVRQRATRKLQQWFGA